jgi:para-aminobenzoate synthetase component I
MKPHGGQAIHVSPMDVPGIPDTCRDQAWERSRLEWRVGDGGDPAALIETFLVHSGISAAQLSSSRHSVSGRHEVCGASVFISAAAGAAMIGGAPAAPSPAGTLPDVVVAVYAHGSSEASASRSRPVMMEGIRGAGPWHLGPWRASWTPREHADAVDAVRLAIADGDVYQVNVVGHAAAEYLGDPLPALRRITRLPGATHAGLLAARRDAGGPDWVIACASPETLLEVRGGMVATRPIKGTAAATAAGREELLRSVKERAEHVMIVDLARNDLSHVAVTGSVRVPELFAVRRWADLWQAESDVVARLRPEVGLADLLRAVCPGGSVTGAPKLAALQQIAALEPVGRGASMGAFGWIGPAGISLGLTIRTVAVDGHQAHTWAGGGITIDSDPWAEVDEARAKAAPIRAALAGF